MAVVISDVTVGSKCYKKGIRGGDSLLYVNGNEICDSLDFDFYITDEKLTLEFISTHGKHKTVKTHFHENMKEYLGLEFDGFLMDKQHHCKNKCIFCFIDQMPKGMRESLYFKDDDSRLSFLFGNYITLTNITEHEIERIIKMHISPVNISVHTMNPELRVKMMNNKNAGESLKIIKRLADENIKINTQLVLCPGINDGKELEYSINELSKMYPSIQSIAAVPVGLTDHREGLCQLSPYTKQQAGEVVDIIESFGSEFKKINGTRLAFAADEFYLKAQRKMPDDDFYEDYPQFDNGVGLWTSFKTEFYDYVNNNELRTKPKTVSVATGEAAFPLLSDLANALEEKVDGLKINVYEIKNRFFGKNITVSGLITGKDLLSQLKGKELGGALFLPVSMIKGTYPEAVDGVFLDDITVTEAEKELAVRIIPSYNNGKEFVKKILEVE